jgi:hypothetical protein
MSSPYQDFASAPRAEQEGVWVDFGSYAFKLARAGGANKRFLRVYDEIMRPYHQQVLAGALDGETDQRLLVSIYARAVILDWRDVADPDGQPLPFGEAAAVRLLLDLPELLRVIQRQATDFRTFRDAERDAIVKN